MWFPFCVRKEADIRSGKSLYKASIEYELFVPILQLSLPIVQPPENVLNVITAVLEINPRSSCFKTVFNV